MLLRIDEFDGRTIFIFIKVQVHVMPSWEGMDRHYFHRVRNTHPICNLRR